MAERESFVLTRDVNVVTIPDGTPNVLSKGEEVTIHQSLGSNYTVVTERGYMVRIAGVDADALGKEIHWCCCWQSLQFDSLCRCC